MAHGAPDYYSSSPKSVVHALQDMAELAARLKSVVTFDRRGDVIALADFSDDLGQWDATPNGVGASIARATTVARSSPGSVNMVPGNANGDQSIIVRSGGITSTGRFGVEVSWTSAGNTSWLLGSENSYFEAASGYSLDWRYNNATKALQIKLLGGAWQTIATTDFGVTALFWHTFKLVADVDTGKYVRAILDGATIDLSAYSLPTVASNVQYGYGQTLFVERIAAGIISLYLDDILFTINEP